MAVVWVVDTETSTTSFNPVANGHIVEFGLSRVNLDTGRIGPTYDAVIKDANADPSAWIFTHSTLTIEQVRDGLDAEQVARFFTNILDRQELTSFNVSFDRMMIERDMWDINQVVQWGDCFMHCAAEIDGIPRNHAGAHIYPTAEATYNYLCPDDPCRLKGHEAHRADQDAEMEAHILLELYRRGLYTPAEGLQ